MTFPEHRGPDATRPDSVTPWSGDGEVEGLALSRAGDGWRDALPKGAVIVHDGDPVMRDTVLLAGGTLLYYAPESWGDRQWHAVGWSNASKQRQYRPAHMPPGPIGPAAVDELGDWDALDDL